MSYRCGVCNEVVPKNQQRKLIVEHHMVKPSPESEREVKQVKKETAVCDACFLKHEGGGHVQEAHK
jgi:hypothetical protein